MSDILAQYRQALTAEIAASDEVAGQLAALAGNLKQTKHVAMAATLLGLSRQLRISALETRGELAAVTPLGLVAYSQTDDDHDSRRLRVRTAPQRKA